MATVHEFMKRSGLTDEQSFYKAYPDEKTFFQHFPDMKPPKAQTGGFIMPGLDPMDMPTIYKEYAEGGYFQKSGYHFDGEKMVKSKGGGTYANGVYFKNGGRSNYSQMGGKLDHDGDIDAMGEGGVWMYSDKEMKETPNYGKGGIHIKKSKVGSLHTHLGVPQGEKIPASKLTIHEGDSPAIKKKKQFAINAKKWHHEYGGEVNDFSNPYHPIHKYMQMGGSADDLTTDPITGQPLQQSPMSQASLPRVAQMPNQSQAGWTQGMNSPQQMQQNIAYGEGSTNAYDPNTGDTDNGPGSVNGQSKVARNNNLQKFGQGFNNLLGAGLMTASYFEDKRNQRYANGQQRDHNMSQNGPIGVNPNGHGLYDQMGQMPMNKYSQSPSMTGYMQDGGSYQRGQELSLSEEEISSLIRKGYKIERI